MHQTWKGLIPSTSHAKSLKANNFTKFFNTNLVCTVAFNKISYGTQGKKPHQNKLQGSLLFTIFRGEGSTLFPYAEGGCSSPATYPTIHKVIIMTRWCSGYFNISSCYFSSIWKPWFVLNSCNNVYSLVSHAYTITRARHFILLT